MIEFLDYVPSEDDIDKVKLTIIKLLFDQDMRLDAVSFVNELDGTKQIKLVLRPKEEVVE